MKKELKEGDIVKLDQHIKSKCRTTFDFIIIDKIENDIIDATFMEDKGTNGKVILDSELLKGNTLCLKLFDIFY